MRPIQMSLVSFVVGIVVALTSCDRRSSVEVALSRAVKAGDVAFVENYLKSGGDADKFVALGLPARSTTSLLHLATVASQPEMVTLLLDYGADVNILDSSGDTPLIRAVRSMKGKSDLKNVLSISDLLLKAGANPELQSSEGHYRYTAMHYAASFGEAQIIKVLLANGASVRCTNKIGQTPLHLAGTAEVAFLLLEAGADPKALTIDGRSPAGTAEWLKNYDALSVITNLQAIGDAKRVGDGTNGKGVTH